MDARPSSPPRIAAVDRSQFMVRGKYAAPMLSRAPWQSVLRLPGSPTPLAQVDGLGLALHVETLPGAAC